jgi:hypothetical protein
MLHNSSSVLDSSVLCMHGAAMCHLCAWLYWITCSCTAGHVPVHLELISCQLDTVCALLYKNGLACIRKVTTDEEMLTRKRCCTSST